MKKKFIIYVFITVIFGLLQVWLACFILFLRKVDFTIIDIIKDGGLFFFASSLTVSSFINHRKIFSNVKYDEIIWSFSFVVFIMIFCAVGYATALNIVEKKFTFETNDRHNWIQFLCSLFAIFYGVITEFRIEKYLPSETAVA